MGGTAATTPEPEKAPAFTGSDAAAAGMMMLAVNLGCAGVGALIGLLLGALVPLLIAGFLVGFGLGISVVIQRFRAV